MVGFLMLCRERDEGILLSQRARGLGRGRYRFGHLVKNEC